MVILLIIYIAMILAVLLFERKNPTEALLWVIVLICLPYFGMILYLIFGDTMAIKITAYIRKKRLSKIPSVIVKTKLDDEAYGDLSTSDKEVIKFNGNYNNSELTCYDDISIFTNGKNHYAKLFEDLSKAKKCIYVEYYTIHNDEVGNAFVELLTNKAKEGVKVFVMCDFIANIPAPSSMYKAFKQAGGMVIRVKPFFTHYRSHRKIVVIDHEISYIGGMNIGRQYANMAKKKNPWRDTQVRMVGACSLVLSEYFLVDWLCSIKRSMWNDMVSYINNLETPIFEATNNLCQFVVGGVDTNKEAIKMNYLSMIRSAKKRIRIQTPYFIPDTSILDALKTALLAGVEIELMVPGVKASFFLDPVTNYYCGQLLEFGAKVTKYRGYIHAKTMIIDDELCCIGSVNLDMRSLMVDDEVCGVFYKNDMVDNYQNVFEEDLEVCDDYTYEDFKGRDNKEKLMESIFVLFAPLM